MCDMIQLFVGHHDYQTWESSHAITELEMGFIDLCAVSVKHEDINDT